VLRVKEGAVDAHLENGASSELWAADLSVVSSNASKVWNLLLAAIDLQVLVDLIIDRGNGSGLDLLDHLWDNRVLKERDEDVGNLGNKSTGELDINVVWIDRDSELLGIKLWSELVSWGRWLCARVELDVDGGLVDLDVSLAVDVEDGPLVVEVGSKLDRRLGHGELGAIALMKELQVDVRGSWLIDVHINVLEVASVEVDLIDMNVLKILEHIGQDEVDTLVHTGLRDRHAHAWTLRSLGRKCGTCN
jgi:hypothetical protein